MLIHLQSQSAYHVCKHLTTFLSIHTIHTSSKCLQNHATDTIYALSTPPSRAALAVFRISGPAADATLSQLLHLPSPTPTQTLPPPRTATLVTLRHPLTKVPLDTALCLRFPAPKSFTGEDVVELQTHGGTAVMSAVSDALQAAGLRLAEPGEFTRRAFEAGRMDLTEVEGLADLLAADTEAQRLQALAAAGGLLRQQYEGWRMSLLKCLARVEAVIDFGEDEGIADEIALEVVHEATTLRHHLQTHITSSSAGELIRDGVKVAILGAPNAGKSSLLNALSGRNVAIVSPAAGTTRDVLNVALNLGGYKVVVYDGAGIRGAVDPVEAEGVDRVLNTARTSHILVHIQEQGGGGGSSEELDQLLAQASGKGSGENTNATTATRTLRVLNKIDLIENDNGTTAALEREYDCVISCSTGQGLDKLTGLLHTAVTETVAAGKSTTGSNAVIVRARHKQHVEECVEALLRYESDPTRLELAAEELRAAAKALGRVTGALDTESVLDSLFSEFCIGK